ncbi:hypothetical protein HMPREF9997_02517 [Corynebacterium durum F0235]|uniref:Uncharacterized protein n=1 Tax=Corynebacterium durum F0235 TaxID=1035195 RepID=L1MA82_9CORY|nr:hypothetical protein HMPREF9997_02517 [Corynebacterium durum F0235]
MNIATFHLSGSTSVLTSVWASRRKFFHSKSRCERNVALLPVDVTFGLLGASRLLIDIYRKTSSSPISP